MLIKISAYIILCLALFGCSEPPYTNIDNAQLISMMKQGVAVYDIRRIDEWMQTGIIENSQRLTFVSANGRLLPNFMPKFTQSVDKNQPVILICRTGNRSAVLARHLMQEMKYTQVYNVRNGITHWISDGNPVVR